MPRSEKVNRLCEPREDDKIRHQAPVSFSRFDDVDVVSTGFGRSYIPSIDGLRAIAVGLVLLYHAGFSSFSGGFIGVDIFFVISGFLISANILKQHKAGTFSFSAFYKRRCARLFPALLTVAFFTLIASYFIVSPDDLKRVGVSGFYSSISVSNVFFWFESDYFDRASEAKPFLHTWSLSVEEQFYLIWPTLLVVFYLIGKKHWRRARIGTDFGIVFCLGDIAAQHTPTSGVLFDAVPRLSIWNRRAPRDDSASAGSCCQRYRLLLRCGIRHRRCALRRRDIKSFLFLDSARLARGTLHLWLRLCAHR